MKQLLIFTLFTALMFCCHSAATAQKDTTQLKSQSVNQAAVNNVDTQDDDFSAFLMIVGSVFVCAMFGAVVVGAFLAAAAALAAVLFVSAGIVSVSVLNGFYKRSVTAGLKTFIITVCTVGGTAIGATGLFIITKFFELHLSGQTAFLTGGAGGLVGGLIMGRVVYKILLLTVAYIKRKLQVA